MDDVFDFYIFPRLDVSSLYRASHVCSWWRRSINAPENQRLLIAGAENQDPNKPTSTLLIAKHLLNHDDIAYIRYVSKHGLRGPYSRRAVDLLTRPIDDLKRKNLIDLSSIDRLSMLRHFSRSSQRRFPTFSNGGIATG